MAADLAALQRAIRKQQDWLELLEDLGKQNVAGVQALLDQYSRAIIRAVGVGTDRTGIAVTTQLQEITDSLDEQLRVLLGDGARAYEAAFQSMGEVMSKSMPRAYVEFGRTTADRVVAAWNSLEFQEQQLPGVFQVGRNHWLNELQETGGSLRNAMQEELVKAQLDGVGQHELANRIAANPLFQFENLPNAENARKLYTAGGRLGENEALRHRANVIARDSISNAANRLHEQWTQAAGFELYINYNPLDDRTTEGCREASEQEPMTLEDWDNWRAESDGQGGRPPRWFLCRSQLMAVPSQYRGAKIEELVTLEV